ncbi:MAG: NADPH-dependent glutamate synthase [Armatimonadetes bacterium]|nr:NADPH-dependent glutamate synthase [Armatimonadota bacterium]
MPKREHLPRTPMPEQDPKQRATNFDEVTLGYTPEMAMAEASRCLACKQKPCVRGCPVNINIPEFVRKVAEGDFGAAAEEIARANALASVCGRVCPQEEQCEKYCLMAKVNGAVAIGRLERFTADWHAAHADTNHCDVSDREPLDQKVAIIGAGPAGLTAAGDLARAGYKVTVFEALHEIGGVLRYGIPEFRLPREILDREIESIRSMGVDFMTNVVIGKTLTIDQLRESGFDAIFVGTGAGLPTFLNIPGEDLNGVYSSNEFLTRVNLMNAKDFPNEGTPVRIPVKAVVVGAGNTAMDSARTALRLGAQEVHIVYRRSRDEMPARAEELHHAEEEGVQFNLLVNPVAFLEGDKGWLRGVRCQRMQLGEPDESGRRRPIPIPETEFDIEADTAIVAVGQSPNPLIRSTTDGLKTTPWGGIVVNEETGETSIPGVYAGGDAVTGAATVITAMGAGRRSAISIDAYLKALRENNNKVSE